MPLQVINQKVCMWRTWYDRIGFGSRTVRRSYSFLCNNFKVTHLVQMRIGRDDIVNNGAGIWGNGKVIEWILRRNIHSAHNEQETIRLMIDDGSGVLNCVNYLTGNKTF